MAHEIDLVSVKGHLNEQSHAHLVEATQDVTEHYRPLRHGQLKVHLGHFALKGYNGGMNTGEHRFLAAQELVYDLHRHMRHMTLGASALEGLFIQDVMSTGTFTKVRIAGRLDRHVMEYLREIENVRLAHEAAESTPLRTTGYGLVDVNFTRTSPNGHAPIDKEAALHEAMRLAVSSAEAFHMQGRPQLLFSQLNPLLYRRRSPTSK